MALKIGSRVYLKGDDFRDPGTIIAVRRSEGIYNSGKLRCRGSLFATVEWDRLWVMSSTGRSQGPVGGGGKREYALSALGDWDADWESDE